MQNLKLKEEGTTKIVEDGAFTISSTVGIETKNAADKNVKKSDSKEEILKVGPSPRFGSQLAIDKGNLYLFGGMVEDANDRQLTHKDFYSIGNFLSFFRKSFSRKIQLFLLLLY